MSCTPGARTSPTNPRSSAGPTHADAQTRGRADARANQLSRLLCGGHRSVVEECEHGEDASVVFFVGADAEFGEDAGDVCLDGAFGEPEPARDATVGAALGHEREHLALPWRERGQLVGRAERAQE